MQGEPDFGPKIYGPLVLWRAANPYALVANVRWREDLTNADFAHFAGIKALNMSGWPTRTTDTGDGLSLLPRDGSPVIMFVYPEDV